MKTLGNIPEDQREKVLAEAYMNIYVDEKKMFNPLLNMPQYFEESPQGYYAYLMMQPEYFHFLCREILGIDLLPIQCAILRELWRRKFPMLIGSRGLGKSFILSIYAMLRILMVPNRKVVVCGAAFRQSKIIFEYMETIWFNSPILRDIVGTQNNGPRRESDMFRFFIGESRVSALPIGCIVGDTLITTSNHVTTIKDLRNEDDNIIYGNGKFRNSGFFFDSGMTETISVKTKKGFAYTATPNHKMKIVRSEEIVWCRTDELKVGDYILIDRSNRWHNNDIKNSVEDSYSLGLMLGDGINLQKDKELFDLWNISNNGRVLPKMILSASKEKIRACLQGLFDVSGNVSNNICFTTTSKKIAEQIHYLLLHFGIISTFSGEIFYEINICGSNIRLFAEKVGFRLKEKQDKLNSILSSLLPDDDLAFNKDYYYDIITSVDKSIIQQTYDINIPEGSEYCANGFFSHNTGDKIRGQRANDIIADEFAAIPKEIFETVIGGFGVVSSNPIVNVKDRAKQKMADSLGIDLGVNKLSAVTDNQTIISGTADYDFNHFYDYWMSWKEIIESRGDKRKLAAYLNKKSPDNLVDERSIPSAFKWTDYSIIRIPYELVPEGFMDAATVARAKASISYGTYTNEYGSCIVDENTNIITDNGYISYKDLVIGDKVLTHLGRFQKITKKTFRNYNGKVYKIRTYGSNSDFCFTVNHPLLSGNNSFEPLNSDYVFLPLLKHLNNNNNISSLDYCNTYSIGKDSINKNIKLDYNFGLVVGYYAAEGSVGAKGRSCNFALGYNEPELVDELVSAINHSLGVNAKVYKKNNTLDVTINSRIVAELFTTICPGKSLTKYVIPEILFSNIDFMKGFLVGFFNGDGCYHKNIVYTTQIISKKLIGQIRLCLSYFNIFSTILECRWRKHENIINGRLVKCNLVYRLDIRNDSINKFNLILNKDNNNLSTAKFNSIDGELFKNKIKSLEILDYQGMVYNLEVENDESYCVNNICMHNCFAKDSNGFFKRSLLENCTCKSDVKIFLPSGPVFFKSTISGNPTCKYVYGIDPAAEVDNFAIIVIELHNDHRRIVYSWTTNKKSQKELLANGQISERDYYSYCSRKIRDLMKKFPCSGIAIDSQGGGGAIMERLNDTDKMRPNEQFIWPLIHPDKPTPADAESGLHIMQVVNFSSAEWTTNANHNLKSDMESKMLIFPFFDAIELALADDMDINKNQIQADSLENCMMDIEELKSELATIVISKTPTGRYKWDTPEIKLSGNKKGRLRKDRYSALLMANDLARNIEVFNPKPAECTMDGGFAQSFGAEETTGPMYNGPATLMEKLNALYN